MDIEHIPESIKPYLNDFIRIGKRFCLQRKNLFIPLMKETSNLHDRICEEFLSTKTKNIYCTKDSENLSEQYSLTFHIKDIACSRTNYTTYDAYNLDLKNIRISFDAIFRRPLETTKTIESQRLLLNELSEYILKIKKKTALLFFMYEKELKRYKKIEEAYNKKWRRLNSFYMYIKEEWNEKYKPGNGDKIYYQDSKTFFTRTGTINYVNQFDVAEIISDKGRKVYRRLDDPSVWWDREFEKSKLKFYMNQIMTYNVIPDIWKENKIKIL